MSIINNIDAYLPENAIHTCEFNVMNTYKQANFGLKFQYKYGFINTILKKEEA